MGLYPDFTHRASKIFAGLNQVSHNQWRGDCPACGYGSSAFLLSRNRDGSYHGWCAACGNQDAIARTLAGEVEIVVPQVDRAARQAKAKKNRERALTLWRSGVSVAGTLAERYLERRGIHCLLQSEELSFHPAISHPHVNGRFPALLAAVTDTAGKFLAVHRIYLGPDGAKAKLEPAKASLGPYYGGVIRLQDYDPAKPLVVGEGIENSVSAGMMIGAPAWSAVVAGALKGYVVLPAKVQKVIIAADPGEVGEDAARWAKHRWQLEGKHVEIARPNPGLGDFNDLLLRGKR
jgi:hypothetical protein